MNIELRPINDVRPYPNNPRCNDAAVKAVMASLKEFGFRQPIVVDEQGVIVVGHTRYRAAQKLGLTHVPVHVATDLTPAQVRAYRVADNQTATIADWNMDLLPLELLGLKDEGFDLDLLGFDADELHEILSKEVGDGLTDPDAVPAMPDEAVTQPGDLWVLGDHRLLCGDSGSATDLDRLLDGNAIHLVHTDPPYGVAVEPRSGGAMAAGLSSFGTQGKAAGGKLRAKDRPIANDEVTGEAFDALLDAWFSNVARVLVPGGSFYVWGGYANLINYPPALKRAGLYFSQAIVWDKLHPVISRKDYMGSFELAYYGWREGAGHHFYGPNNATDLWHIKKVSSQQSLHLTEKAVELSVRAIGYSSLKGQNVLDLFGGSGSTLIGCEQTGRHAYLMELDALYCDVIVKRWEEFTGRKARRYDASGNDVSETTPAAMAGVVGGGE